MDLEAAELSRERAVSSAEPCSTRPNPFDDDEEHSSRKRQRVSSRGSRSRSVDAVSSPITPEGTEGVKSDPSPPRTPTRIAPNKASLEPTSSRVTINLRSARTLESKSSLPQLAETPSKMAGPAIGLEKSVELVGDLVLTKTPTQTPSASSSAVGSPEIEVIAENDEDSELANQDLSVAIIDDDDDILLDEDPIRLFPYNDVGESLPSTVRKISRFFEFENVENDEAFCKLRDWMEAYLRIPVQERLWYENYLNHRDFWDQLPDTVWSLSRRRSFFDQFLHRNRDSRRAITEFFCQFARLTARFVVMDVRTLSHMDEIIRSNTEPILASRLYLQAFGWLLRKDEVPHIGRNLETHYHWNWNDDMSMLMNTFLTAGGNIPNLVRLAQGHLALVSRFPKLIDNLAEPSRIVNRAVIDAAAILNDPEASHRQYIETSQQIMSQGYQYYKVMATGLMPIIEKHVTFLSPDAATAHVTGLTSILFYSLCFDGCPARELLEDHRRRYPDLPPAHSSTVISNEWKFEVLNKLIVSGQMQLRVIGTTTMCTDLLNMFTKYKREDPTSHPLLLYFANFILQNKLVDYIVGTGSHPEIISESGNIVGFLVATKTYTTKQTDIIWQTVMTSQDPRVVEAILRMLGQILNLHTYDSLLYLCKKAGELPIESFTAPMREYCERLLQLLINRATAEGALPIDAPPYELCVRLIRESSIARSDAPMGSLEIQHFASTILRELVTHGPEARVRNSIYVNCIEDISNRTQTSPGSICALFGLLRQNLATDLYILTTNHGLTRLMVEELEFTNSSDRLTSVVSNANSPARQARRELLLSIIVHEPSTITAELGTRLWSLLVGQDAQSNANREIGWQILNSAAKKASSTTNVFIATCFKDHLPNLDPECYTIGSLDFAREAMLAWVNEAGDLLFESLSPSLSGVEQLWRMVLNAPPNTIEAPAVNTLVDLYVDSTEILKKPRLRAYNIHLALVNRCLSQLSSAASKLKCFIDETMNGDDEPMVIVTSENQIREQELIFTRSLIFLREFLRSYQSKSHFVTPKLKSPTLNPSDEPRGEPLDIKYQTFDGGSTGEVQTLSMGKQNTMATLFTTIRKAAGFKGCKIYHWGKEIGPDCTDLNASLEDLKIGKGLLLVQRRDEEDNSEGRLKGRSSTLELEIIKHFDELWDYLGMEEKLAKEIYYFLIKFPVYSKLLAAFENDDTPCTEIFPLGQPFKCLYAIHALREHLAARSREGLMNTATLSRSVGLIVSAITNREVLGSCVDDDLRSFLALHLTECLTKLLREPVPAESLGSHLSGALLERLLQLLCTAKAAATSPNSVQLVANAFEAILEASFHSPQLWSAFRSHPKTPHLLCELILLDPRPGLRKGVLKQITNKCCYASSLSSLSTTEFAMTLWPILYDLVPQAVMHPQKCEEALSVTLLVFRKLADTSIDSVDVEKCLTCWGSLLVRHQCREDVGHPESLDIVARGLANLLYWCASFAKAARQPLPPNTLATKLFTKHLFSELSNPDIEESIVECLPLLNTGTRKLISDTMLFLTKDDEVQYQQIMELLVSLLPYDPDEEVPYAMDLTFSFDRSKSVRSATGYVGLKNLSNTCYLNSLFTQLFMNISFRGFMLNAYVADGGGSQKLLYETQKLFSFMQNSLKRYVDPSNLAASIRTYEETGIDVSIQMDVDEFYNLLFDRWESQILSAGDKREFRSFYGGQLVQQVKSKECTHISERLEPFSAIQCDIKGKTSLQESLQAYVDGEIMEGDNKYKCSSCDRHVNAVKRACLKDIPDNLIFHLKRFDFNLRTMQRSKINDYFSFPHRIDMRPYKVEHIMESPDETPEDIFELVGILVHAGTAESGHYYSYIRERPSYSGQSANWVEFNDDNVSSFDPSCIEASCFGGPDYRTVDSGNYQYEKSWSAYMLFYERSSVLQAKQSELKTTDSHPVRLPIHRQLSNYIAEENEMLIRKYCLYDEGHAPFVLRMLDNDQHITKGRCSQEHAIEKIALYTVLHHLDQVVVRTKDLPDFASYILALRQRFEACSDCSSDFLEWLISHHESLRQMLFRNPDQLVRSEIASAVVLALSKVKQDTSPGIYGLYDSCMDDGEGSDISEANPRLFTKILSILSRFWETFHLHARAWPEYFGLLVSIAHLGNFETAALLDCGFLRKVLEAIVADHALNPTVQMARMLSIISKRPVTKPVSFENMIALLEVLLKACDLQIPPVDDTTSRLGALLDEQPMPLTLSEHYPVVRHWTRGPANILVEKLLFINQNERSTQEIIATLLRDGPELNHRTIMGAIRSGIQKTTATNTAAPFLRAALTYCEYTTSHGGMADMIKTVTNTTRLLDSTEGKEHLQFFKDLLELPQNNANVDRDTFFRFVIDQIPIWSPSLLTYYDSLVRTDTEDYLQQTILMRCITEPTSDMVQDAEENARAIMRVARILGISCLKHLHEEYVRSRTQAVKANLLSIQGIIELCKPLYRDTDQDDTDLKFQELYLSVIPALRRITVEEADDDVSEWDNSDDAFSSSEVLENIAELGAGGGDLHDPDMQA